MSNNKEFIVIVVVYPTDEYYKFKKNCYVNLLRTLNAQQING